MSLVPHFTDEEIEALSDEKTLLIVKHLEISWARVKLGVKTGFKEDLILSYFPFVKKRFHSFLIYWFQNGYSDDETV